VSYLARQTDDGVSEIVEYSALFQFSEVATRMSSGEIILTRVFYVALAVAVLPPWAYLLARSAQDPSHVFLGRVAVCCSVPALGLTVVLFTLWLISTLS
jgi:hypothetical protein